MAPPVVRLVKVRIFGEHFVDRCVQVKRNDPPVSEAPHNTAAAAALQLMPRVHMQTWSFGSILARCTRILPELYHVRNAYFI